MSKENSVSVIEEDDYDLFEASRNKEISALSAEYASMLRRQRAMLQMADIFVKRVPPSRRAGVEAALRVQHEDLIQMRRRFSEQIKTAIRSQSRVFDVRMRFESDSSMLMNTMSASFFSRVFKRKKHQAERSQLQEKTSESITELKSAMDDWAQSMSMVYRLLPEWRRIQAEMLEFLETQQTAYRKAEQLVDGQVKIEQEQSTIPFLQDVAITKAVEQTGKTSRGSRKAVTH